MFFKCTKKQFNEEVASAFATNHVLIDGDSVFMYYRVVDRDSEFYYNKDLLVYRNTKDNTYQFFYYNKVKLIPLILRAKRILAKKNKI